MKLFGLPVWFLAILFGLVLCLAPVARAQDSNIEVDDASEDEEFVDDIVDNTEDLAEEEEEDKFQYIYQTREVQTSHIFFPKYPDMVIPTGKVVEAVIGIENVGSSRFNMTYMRAQLLHPQERDYAIENYTANAYNVLVGPGEQHTFVYYFQANEFIQPRPDFGFRISLIFHEMLGPEKAGRTFSHTVFDGTIELTRENVFDMDLLLLYAGGAAVIAVIFYFMFQPSSGSSSAKKYLETGTKRNLSPEDEWLEGTHAETRRRNVKRS